LLLKLFQCLGFPLVVQRRKLADEEFEERAFIVDDLLMGCGTAIMAAG